MKPVVDKTKCISCGACAQTCPEVFFMDDDNFAEARVSDAEGNPVDYTLYEPQIIEAIGSCPNQAISNADAEGAEEDGEVAAPEAVEEAPVEEDVDELDLAT